MLTSAAPNAGTRSCPASVLLRRIEVGRRLSRVAGGERELPQLQVRARTDPVARLARQRALQVLGRAERPEGPACGASHVEPHRTLALNPSYPTAHHFLAQLLTSLGRHDDAIAAIEAARHVDPLSPAINAYVPYIFLAARRYARAVSEGEAAVRLDPHSPAAHWQLGRAYLWAGNVPAGLETLNASVDLGGRMPMFLAVLGFARARAEDVAGAQAILAELSERARNAYVSPYDFVVAHAGLGNTDAALTYLEHAYRERVMRIISLGDPELDGLRREPRFVAVARQLRLPTAAPVLSGKSPAGSAIQQRYARACNAGRLSECRVDGRIAAANLPSSPLPVYKPASQPAMDCHTGVFPSGIRIR